VKLQTEYPIVRGDKQRLIEIVQNLLDNAAKFSKKQPDSFIEIGTGDSDSHNQSIFYVRDNGIGIDPKFHDRIFGLFNKLNPDIEGTGIGLTLVKRIVEIHGGRIWIDSELDRGATFYFTLPEKKE
jgi:signal transduction histidine kinase